MSSGLLHHNLSVSADRYPDNPAFRFAGDEVCYGELERISNQVARQLKQCGVSRGDRVGLFLDRCLETAQSVYGILKAGAAYVPIDPSSPISRIQNIIRSCDIRCLVTAANKASFVADSLLEVGKLAFVLGCDDPRAEHGSGHDSCRFIGWPEILEQNDSSCGTPGAATNDLAYIIFTSGSTGEPKGIMHTHDSGHAYARITVQTYAITAEDRIGNHAPLHFDISTMGYLAAPLAGASTIIIPEPHTRIPASMSRLAEDERFTIWYSVPFALIQLLTRGALGERDLSSLRWVLYGGDPFSPRQIRDLMDLWPHARFANVYGPAEVNQCTLHVIPDSLSGSEEAIPIGDVWPETEALIVDPDDMPVPPDEIGELLIHTPTMMQGYWNRPALNEQRFYHHPVEGKTYFRTGDLASRDRGGLMHYHGRLDRLVKVRGNRVELDEVEAAVLTHPMVVEAAAYVLDPGSEHERMELALLLDRTAADMTEELRAHVEARLPRYAIPDRFVYPSCFPRTTSGKIDRRRLASMQEGGGACRRPAG